MKRIFLIFTILLFNIVFSFGQTSKGDSPIDNEKKILEEFSKGLTEETTKSSQLIPTGNDVDPNFYYVGPGDIVSLNIFPIIPYPMLVTISPTSTLIIPRFGEIELKNKTLSQAQDTIQKFLQEKNKDIKVSLVLQKPRLVLVSIKGNVVFPNVYTIPASFQVSSAINYANKVNPDNIQPAQFIALTKYNEQIREREKLFGESKFSPNSNYYERNVSLLRNDGTAKDVDIIKAKALNDPQFNPYVKEGDEIIVPFEFQNYPTIQIAGEVNRPITVPFKEGDSLSILLKMGYGLTANADIDNVKLFLNEQPININLDKDANLKQPNIGITPGAILVVGSKNIKSKNKISTVSISGEVKKPGIYVIENEKTRLKDLISMAGGFTDNAHLPLASIYRFEHNTEYKLDIKKDFNESFQYSNLTLEDTTRFLIDMYYSKNYVSCDFDKLFNSNDDKYNVILRGGDIINIPEQPHQIYIYGQVANPGYIEYEPNKTMEYYVSKAGGYADGAEKDRARIIRGRNFLWEKPGDNVYVNAGDQIYVPRKPDIPAWLEIQKYGTYAALIGAAATLINILYGIYLTQTNK